MMAMTTRDMTAPNWARTLARLRRYAEELKAYDFQVKEPRNADVPPEWRNGRNEGAGGGAG
jgi:hypothetical protein